MYDISQINCNLFSLFHWFQFSFRSVLVVVGNTVSWEDSWLDGGLAWLVGPLAFISVPLWWLWSSLLTAASGQISSADWLAVCRDPLIAGWKLRKILDFTNGLDLEIICHWPWTVVSSNLSAVSSWSLSISVHTSALWELWGSSGELVVVWSSILFIITLGLDEPISSSCESSNLSALNLSATSIWTVHSCTLWQFWKVKAIRWWVWECFFIISCNLNEMWVMMPLSKALCLWCWWWLAVDFCWSICSITGWESSLRFHLIFLTFGVSLFTWSWDFVLSMFVVVSMMVFVMAFELNKSWFFGLFFHQTVDTFWTIGSITGW